MAGAGAHDAVGRLRGLVIDADDLELLAAFWGALLGVGVAEQFEDWILLDAGPSGTYLAFQPRDASEPGAAAPLRPDLEVADLETASNRIETLGGRLVDVIDDPGGFGYHLMADPEGNEFAIVLPQPKGSGRLA